MPETAFLNLWGILEALTNTVGDRYDVTIRRVSYLFSGPVFDRYVLERLRLWRNRSVHFGDTDSTGLARELLVKLHRYVCQLLLFILKSARFFESLEEVATFLSLPDDKIALERGAKLRKEALKFKRHVGG